MDIWSNSFYKYRTWRLFEFYNISSLVKAERFRPYHHGLCQRSILTGKYIWQNPSIFKLYSCSHGGGKGNAHIKPCEGEYKELSRVLRVFAWNPHLIWYRWLQWCRLHNLGVFHTKCRDTLFFWFSVLLLIKCCNNWRTMFNSYSKSSGLSVFQDNTNVPHDYKGVCFWISSFQLEGPERRLYKKY